MTTAFIVFQLGFNILVLTALLVLALRSPRHTAGRPSKARVAPAARQDGTAPAPRQRAAHVTALVEQANERELAAEAALRERLARFRQQRVAS